MWYQWKIQNFRRYQGDWFKGNPKKKQLPTQYACLVNVMQEKT